MRRLLPICIFLACGTALAETPGISLEITARGAVTERFVASHRIDRAHFCSAAADPWRAPRGVDTRPAPFPFYRVAFGHPRRTAPPEAPGPSLALVLSRWAPPGTPGWREAHGDAAHDEIEVVLAGRRFAGRPGMAGPRLMVAWRDDGQGGAFVATGLQEVGGQERVDVEGIWSCPPIETTRSAVAPVPVLAPPGRAEAVPVREFMLRREGRAWRATAPDGSRLRVRVSDGGLRLAPSVQRAAERGEVILLVQAEVLAGKPPRVRLRRLDGVLPARP
jgi:hypothetical protein